MINGPPMSIDDVIKLTEQLHASLLTATASNDLEIVHASIIAAVAGMLGWLRSRVALNSRPEATRSRLELST